MDSATLIPFTGALRASLVRGRILAPLILAPATGLAALLSLAVPAAAQPPPQADATKSAVDAAAIVSRYGLRAIDPPLPAPDFTLPALGGGEASLSDYRGNWVVLTFWATWCGPCRQEMPTLEALHRSREARGLVVLGVSTDAKRAQAEPYVRNEGVTFPNLWDGRGQAARLYQATSIPLSYVVDPRGRLVAVSRGARDWSALAPMLDALQGASPRVGAPGDGQQIADSTSYAGGDVPVELPSVLNPPTAEVAVSNPHPRPGHPFFLQVRLHWAGNFEEYLPHPPQVALPEGIVQGLVTASTDSAGGRNQVVYNITLEAREPGTYALDPVELRYTSRFESMPLATQIQGPTVEVKEASMAGLSPALLAGAGLLALALAGAGTFLFLRRRRRTETGAEEDPSLEGHRRRLEEARSLRLQGKAAAAYAELLELELALGVDDELARARRRDDLEQARYGGVAPPPGELDRLQKQLERRLAERRPNPEQSRRRALKLREQET